MRIRTSPPDRAIVLPPLTLPPMPRKYFKRYMPSADKVRGLKILGLFGETLFHPALWDLNRRSAAGGVATGLFCGLIPGPLQMLGAGVAAILFRINLPVALLTTLYTNPITIVPLYLIAAPPPDWVFSQPLASAEALGQWMLGLGTPLVLGVFLLACILSVAGYVAVRVMWSIHLRRAWARRRQRRSARGAS